MKKFKLWIKKYLGPAFVILEAVMHVYLAIYLTLNWTNWPIWAFTVFEMSMFIYLLVTRKKNSVIS
jgi:uncharacterized protein (DUF983 family)